MNNTKARKTPNGDPQARVRALLTVARDAQLATIWARSGGSPLRISDVARVALEEAGLTQDEIDSVLRSAPGRKAKAATRGRGKKANSEWTAAEEKTICAMWAKGATTGQIAKSLGRTTAGVNARITRLRKAGLVPARRPERAKHAARARQVRLSGKK